MGSEGAMALPRPGTKRAVILMGLAVRPLSSVEVADLIDDIPAYVARTIRPMCIGGLTFNANPGKGRSALWSLTDSCRSALNPQGPTHG